MIVDDLWRRVIALRIGRWSSASDCQYLWLWLVICYSHHSLMTQRTRSYGYWYNTLFLFFETCSDYGAVNCKLYLCYLIWLRWTTCQNGIPSLDCLWWHSTEHWSLSMKWQVSQDTVVQSSTPGRPCLLIASCKYVLTTEHTCYYFSCNPRLWAPASSFNHVQY
mgnify:CR=1 FL=1